MQEAKTKSIEDLQRIVNTKTLHLLLLSFATVGVYAFLYMREKQAQIEEITGCPKPIGNDAFVVCTAAAAMWGQQITNIAAPSDGFLIGIGFALSIIAIAFYITWAFRAKKAIEQYAVKEFLFDYKMNPILTCFLNLYYVNYKINDLAEKYIVDKALRGEQPSSTL